MDPAGGIWTSKLGKNRIFYRCSLSAKFNRFFIILGGGSRFGRGKSSKLAKTSYLDKTRVFADFSEACFICKINRFLRFSKKRGVLQNHAILGKTQFFVGFFNFSLSAKFNRFFIILGGRGVLRIYVNSNN